MAMGKRGRQRQENLFIASNTLVKSPGHPFYEKLNQVLEANGFDEFVEGLCQRYYAPHMGRKGILDAYLAKVYYIRHSLLWDVATRENIATFEGHTGRVGSVSFSPDGT